MIDVPPKVAMARTVGTAITVTATVTAVPFSVEDVAITVCNQEG